MPELSSAARTRWFRLRLPGDCKVAHLWAEKYFESQAEAFDYFERRQAEYPTRRVHPPVPSRENDGAWAVCGDPV